MINGRGTLALPSSMLEMQNLKPYPRPTESDIAFLQNPLATDVHIKF